MKPTTARIRRGLDDLKSAMYQMRTPLSNLRILPLGTNLLPGDTPIPNGDAHGWRPIAPGGQWGGRDENAWFHGEAMLPTRWKVAVADSHAIALRILLGVSTEFGWPEGLLYVDGRLLQGMNQHHTDVLLPTSAAQGETLRIDVRAWSGMLPRAHRFEYAELALLNRDIEALYHLLLAGCDLVDALDVGDPLLHPLAQALESTYDEIDLRNQAEDDVLESAAATALVSLRARLAELRASYTPAERPGITAIGHGHLDVAWLWQTRHTREKAARTFSIATALMDRYPEYHFLHTTPQVFAWLEQDYPEIFERVRAHISEGRFEAAGAMWVESDTNLVSGESLVRQIMYGQRYLRETFGAEYDALWLPDTFGYSYALPQIMLRSGLRAFMTTKMSWSDTNRIPYDTFRWRGLDGSETLAHFVTTPSLPLNHDFDTDTYNARLDVPAVRMLWERYRSKAQNRDLLLVYGHGDGGAGPTRQHIESYRALRELPGMPAIHLGRADAYFRALRERVWSQPDLPTWDGELYLEFHRGVYTTQAWLKRLHRRLEERLLLAESLDAARWAHAAEGAAPDERATLDDAWRTLLMHEFHDILPGSSIGPVYADARATLTALAERIDSFIAQAERDIATQRGAASESWLLHNPSPCATPGPVATALIPLEADEPAPTLDTGNRLLNGQIFTDTAGQRFAMVETPPIAGRGWLALRSVAPEKPHSRPPDPLRPRATATEDGGVILENGFYRCAIDARGEITSLIDKRVTPERELISAGEVGNHIIAFDDRPRRFGGWEFDAWDIDASYNRKSYPLQTTGVAITEHGPVRATVRINRRFQSSAITQDISLYHGLPRIDFATRIDWREHHILLKVAFPLDLRTTQARSEIQYGSISRPTHSNTSWDQARFETVAHRWVDLSEGDYGVALLNDGGYGHDIHGSVVRLTLLRSPTSPDPAADQGEHEVTYSLLPHAGAWPVGDVVAHGYALNRPLRALRPTQASLAGREGPTRLPAPRPLFRVDDGSVIVEAIKRAAEGDDLIVRLYESTGSRTETAIHCDLPIERIIETDLLERPLTADASPAFGLWQASRAASHDAPAIDADGWSCQFRPFEIRTFRVSLHRPYRRE